MDFSPLLFLYDSVNIKQDYSDKCSILYTKHLIIMTNMIRAVSYIKKNGHDDYMLDQSLVLFSRRFTPNEIHTIDKT